ncbi:MAG: response regulator [Deltaproteobacteria bacterium]|jgi:ATP/maltotriose-dependent transcriptional regulator MalT/ActR/RegA family two-component response regulator|nr:response regulator [Deltaproteobacteria bacterium]
MATTILLVDDHPLFRKGLRVLLEEQADFRIVGGAQDGRGAIDKVRKLSPDVVLMDITMPDLDGIDATRQILTEAPAVKVIALSMHAGKRFVEDMLRAGAAGYILKKSGLEDLVNGIRMVVQGEIYLSPAITGIVVSEYRELIEKSSSTAKMKDPLPIVHTKLSRPKLSPDLVPRSDLMARLFELRGRPLTLVSAAAGYGKSTMASQCLEAWDDPYAWLSLDDEENDFRQFINYLLAAIGNALPGPSATTRSLLQAPEIPPVPVLSRYLLNDLDQIEGHFILVLDDYHKIREKMVHDLLGAVLAHPPQNLHMMLLTRRDPPILTSTIRALGHVNEVGTANLRFTVTETTAFLENTLGHSVDEKTAETIQETLEGWPAGMRLVSQSKKLSGDLDSLLAGLKGGLPAIVDYLMNEVLSHQPPEMARWMTATAILDHFCAPLCDALHGLDTAPDTGKMNGDEFIARLQKDNLFLIGLDTENRWFRYHHLFRQLLQDQLNRHWSPDEVATLHSRAKAWFSENDISGDAIKDPPAALRDDEHKSVPDATADKGPSLRPPTLHPLVEPLTNRELDVLELLAQRLSNQEIAEKMFVSITTVKTHLQNIYGKLGVSKRREAVEKAKNLGIL